MASKSRRHYHEEYCKKCGEYSIPFITNCNCTKVLPKITDETVKKVDELVKKRESERIND